MGCRSVLGSMPVTVCVSRKTNLCMLMQTRLSSYCARKAWLLPRRRYMPFMPGFEIMHCFHQSEAASMPQAARNALEGLVCVATSDTAAVAVEVRLICICMICVCMHATSLEHASLQPGECSCAGQHRDRLCSAQCGVHADAAQDRSGGAGQRRYAPAVLGTPRPEWS